MSHKELVIQPSCVRSSWVQPLDLIWPWHLYIFCQKHKETLLPQFKKMVLLGGMLKSRLLYRHIIISCRVSYHILMVLDTWHFFKSLYLRKIQGCMVEGYQRQQNACQNTTEIKTTKMSPHKRKTENFQTIPAILPFLLVIGEVDLYSIFFQKSEQPLFFNIYYNFHMYFPYLLTCIYISLFLFFSGKTYYNTKT